MTQGQRTPWATRQWPASTAIISVDDSKARFVPTRPNSLHVYDSYCIQQFTGGDGGGQLAAKCKDFRQNSRRWPLRAPAKG
jgi:hypothetical protein